MIHMRTVSIIFSMSLLVVATQVTAQKKTNVASQQRQQILAAMQDIEDRITTFYQDPTQDKLDALTERFGKNLKYIPPKQEVAVLGAIVCVVAIQVATLPLFLVGMILVGVGSGTSNMSRYAAADLASSSRRSQAIVSVVFFATFGAVLAPN